MYDFRACTRIQMRTQMRTQIKIWIKFLFITLLYELLLFTPVHADEFVDLEMSFKNFIKCELTRTQAISHFNDKPFKITMIDLFNIQNESDIEIITGAVQCFVVDKHTTLFAAVGLKTIKNKKQVLYYTIRKKDFSILATELFKYPYKERCKWSQYWIPTD